MDDAFDHSGDPAHYRRRAAHMRALAAETANSNLREMLERLAIDYDLLADRMERRPRAERPRREQG